MTRDDALGKWTHCAQVCERKGSYFLEDNDGSFARKLMPYPDATVETVEPTGIWPSGRYTHVLKVVHVAAVPETPARPPLPGRPGKPARFFYVAARKEG